MKSLPFARWQGNFLTGLAIVLPAVVSFAVIIWLFGTVANITDTLLIFLPRKLTHQADGVGPMHWYWSLVALLVAVFFICLVGLAARHYLGKRIIAWADMGMLRVPILNKIYSATKQVHDAFYTSKNTAFRTVVLVEFPCAGTYSIGFITHEDAEAIRPATGQKVCCVFVPTTPNPTTGFLILQPIEKVTKLDISVSDAIKYIISLGARAPDPPLQKRLSLPS